MYYSTQYALSYVKVNCYSKWIVEKNIGHGTLHFGWRKLIETKCYDFLWYIIHIAIIHLNMI